MNLNKTPITIILVFVSLFIVAALCKASYGMGYKAGLAMNLPNAAKEKAIEYKEELKNKFFKK